MFRVARFTARGDRTEDSGTTRRKVSVGMWNLEIWWGNPGGRSDLLVCQASTFVSVHILVPQARSKNDVDYLGMPMSDVGSETIKLRLRY
jgi:hypothetical protein